MPLFEYTSLHALTACACAASDRSVVRAQLNRAACSSADMPTAEATSVLLEADMFRSTEERATPDPISTPRVSVAATMNSINEKPLMLTALTIKQRSIT